VRVYVLLTFFLAGCANVQVASQSLEEGVSGVLYTITTDTVNVSSNTTKVLRPPPRPTELNDNNKQQNTIISVKDQIKPSSHIDTAYEYIGFTETTHRTELKSLLGIDPRTVEWCAAFVNSVLQKNNIEGSESVSPTPLMARSFLDWGDPIDHKKEDPQVGDVVVFPRGRASWQGHVGFYLDTIELDGKKYWRILGGNQRNSVNIELYDPQKVLGVRRREIVYITDNQFPRIFGNFFKRIT